MKKDIKITEQKFDNYEDLISSAKNWEHSCTYQLSPNALIGIHKVIEFADIQISFSSREGGIMHNLRSPKNSISIGIIEECEAEACFENIKLRAGDIIFFDDQQSYRFMSNGRIKSVTLSINKHTDREIIECLSNLKGYLLKDKEKILSKLLHENEKIVVNTQEKILTTLENILDMQEPIKPKLTKGEEIAFKILENIYHHMDGNISINSFSLQYGVSEKTLQNSFKSLFGFTPKIFFRQLKLNLVHHELKNGGKTQASVSKVAMKWGFKHMGHFSKYYKELFGEIPSQILKKSYTKQYEIDHSCVSRQEEMQ